LQPVSRWRVCTCFLWAALTRATDLSSTIRLPPTTSLPGSLRRS
jgi:hypothetical protein